MALAQISEKLAVTSLAQGVADLGLLKVKSGRESPSHKIRTPLHATADALESLQEAYKIIFAAATDAKVELAGHFGEIEKAVVTIQAGLDKLTSITVSYTTGDRAKQEGEGPWAKKPLKVFSDKVKLPLSRLDAEFKLLQAAHKHIVETPPDKRNEWKKEPIHKHLTALSSYIDTLITIAEEVTGSPEVKKAAHLRCAPLLLDEVASFPSVPKPTLIVKEEVAGLSEAKKAQIPQKALVVDDNAVNQKILTGHLKRLGWKAWEIANDGKEAVELAEKEKFAIIFMDIKMPVMDGFEATKQIRESATGKNKTTPVICVSAETDQKHRETARTIGMKDFIAKPFGKDRIGSMLQQYAGYQPLSVGSTSDSDTNSTSSSSPRAGSDLLSPITPVTPPNQNTVRASNFLLTKA